MFTTKFELIAILAAFILGGFEGPRLWSWLKSWFVKEEQVIVTKITGHTGPPGG